MKFKDIFKFEEEISKFTGAPYVITTCSCTQALELCFRVLNPSFVKFTCFTYVGIPMLLKNLNVSFNLIFEKWSGMYKFHNTSIWDSARKFTPNMYIPDSYICLSFGENKPLDLGRGGAILLDNEEKYKQLNKLRFDGRNINNKTIEKEQQIYFDIGYHYKLNNRECINGLLKLKEYITVGEYYTPIVNYRDCRKMIIKDINPLYREII